MKKKSHCKMCHCIGRICRMSRLQLPLRLLLKCCSLSTDYWIWIVYFLSISRTQVLLWDHCFGLMLTSALTQLRDPLGFETACYGFLKFICGATPADLMVARIVASRIQYMRFSDQVECRSSNGRTLAQHCYISKYRSQNDSYYLLPFQLAFYFR